MNIEEYSKIFQKAFELTANEEASIAIMQEIGKDNRTPKSNFIETVKNADVPLKPASLKQKNYLKGLNIKFDENISSLEASELIKQNSKRKGG